MRLLVQMDRNLIKPCVLLRDNCINPADAFSSVRGKIRRLGYYLPFAGLNQTILLVPMGDRRESCNPATRDLELDCH